MDLTKVGNCGGITYRLSDKDAVQRMELVDRLLEMKEKGEMCTFTTLQFLGFLWLEIETARVARRPRTAGEKKWYADYEKQLNRLFPAPKDSGNVKDYVIEYHIEMINMLKQALVAMAFSNISEATLAALNARYVED